MTYRSSSSLKTIVIIIGIILIYLSGLEYTKNDNESNTSPIQEKDTIIMELDKFEDF